MRGESQLALEICFLLLPSPPSIYRSIDRLTIKSVYRLKIRAGLFDVVVVAVACLPAPAANDAHVRCPKPAARGWVQPGKQATRQHLARAQLKKKG